MMAEEFEVNYVDVGEEVFRNVASIFIYGFFSHSILVARYIHQNKLSGITTFAV